MIGIGDLAQTLMQNARQRALKTAIDVHGAQLTTGLKVDPARHLRGATAPLAVIEGDLARLSAWQKIAGETQIRATVMQDGLGKLADAWQEPYADLLRSELTARPEDRALMAARARTALEETISVLNTQSAGRALFAGTATDGAALASADDLLASVTASLVGAADATEVAARLDTWFDAPGGGFEMHAYLGSAEDLAPQQLTDHVSVTLSLRADDPEFRAGMKALVAAIVAADPGLNLPDAEARDLQTGSGEALATAMHSLTSLRAGLGTTEARIETALDRIGSDRDSADLSRLRLIGSDEYEDAIKLQAAQLQLESLYSVIVTQRRMSFLEALR